MAEESLKNKTIKGTAWSAADAFLGQGVTFIVGIILARLLSPDEYGLIGICLIFNTVLSGIVDSGFSNALIRKNDCTQDDYNTMFITNMAISIIIYVSLYFTTPFIAFFFKLEQLIWLIRITSIVLIINALSLTQQTVLIKRLDFKTKTKSSVSSAILSGIIGIGMAYEGFGVWALVGQILSKQLFYSIGLWLLVRWIPTFHFCKKSFHYMWGFGWKLLASGLLSNIWNQLYQVVVGKFYSPATLGQYTRANEYANIFSSNLTVIIQRVSFPVLSNIQDDKEKLISSYRKFIKMTMFITCSCMLLLAAVSKPLIICLVGDKWLEAATYLPLICISMSMYPLHALNLNLLQVLGRSDIFLFIEILKKIIGIIPLVIGIFINIYWMLIASIFAGVVCFFINSYYTGRKLGYTSLMQIKDVIPYYFVAGIVTVIVYCINYLNISVILILIPKFRNNMKKST